MADFLRQYFPTYYIKGAGEVDVAYIDQQRFWPVEVKWSCRFRPKDLKQIAKYQNGRILTKSLQSGSILGRPASPLPLCLLRLGAQPRPENRLRFAKTTISSQKWIFDCGGRAMGGPKGNRARGSGLNPGGRVVPGPDVAKEAAPGRPDQKHGDSIHDGHEQPVAAIDRSDQDQGRNRQMQVSGHEHPLQTGRAWRS